MIEFDLDLWHTGEYDLFNRRGEKFENIESKNHLFDPLLNYFMYV